MKIPIPIYLKIVPHNKGQKKTTIQYIISCINQLRYNPDSPPGSYHIIKSNHNMKHKAMIYIRHRLYCSVHILVRIYCGINLGPHCWK